MRIQVWPLATGCGTRARILFIVQDTGSGITGEQLESIFQPFSQGEKTYTRKYQGTGLGLSIVKKKISRLDGELAMDNGGGGTTAYLSLPLEIRGEKDLQIRVDPWTTPAYHKAPGFSWPKTMR